MTALDYLILAIFLIFAVWGMVRGLIAEVFSILAWVAALYVGSHYGEAVAPWLESSIESVSLRRLIACVAVGIAVGFEVGLAVGVAVGFAVGLSVGLAVGFAVGLVVG